MIEFKTNDVDFMTNQLNHYASKIVKLTKKVSEERERVEEIAERLNNLLSEFDTLDVPYREYRNIDVFNYLDFEEHEHFTLMYRFAFAKHNRDIYKRDLKDLEEKRRQAKRDYEEVLDNLNYIIRY